VRQAVDDGWLNVVEAEQKLKQVAANDLSGCEVVFLTGPNVVQASDLTELDERLPTAHLAVTSPALPLARLAAELSGRGRVVGVHFRQSLLSPSEVEVVATPWTDAATIAALHRWLERCGQWPTITSPDDGAHATPVAA
jgi:3-hydroxyacyl-CoA dehydrogenase